MHDHPGCSFDGPKGALDQLAATLGEYLQPDVVRRETVLDDLADEVVVGLARRGEPHFDLGEPDAQQLEEELSFATRVHRFEERLVPVPQVDRAPSWCRPG